MLSLGTTYLLLLSYCSVYLLLLVVVEWVPLAVGDSCNEFVCGSVVSKCLLTQSCQCKLSDCYCCKDCLNCLGDLYMECCSCLDMCPEHNETLTALVPTSQIGDLEGLPELFDTLTADESDDLWTTIRFPMRIGVRRGGGGDAIDQHAAKHKKLAHGTKATSTTVTRTVNCTVIYFNTCVSNHKCAQDCESMGSNSYRWFHDGCCECIGAYCYNYGINESRCTACPPDDNEDDNDNEDFDNFDADYDGAGGGGGGGVHAGSDGVVHMNGNTDRADWDYGEDEFNYN